MKRRTVVLLKLARQLRGACEASALLAGLIIMLAVPTMADTIGISDGKLIIGTEPGDGNQVFMPTIAGANLVLANVDATIVTAGCSGTATITCPLADFQELVILGGNGDDVINLSAMSGFTFEIIALGGAGDDVLIGTPGNVKLFGGPGDDVIVSMAGNCFSRGTGADIVIGSGCDAGPEPVFAPLPRQIVATPEPGGFWLLGSGLVGLLGMTRRRNFKRRRAI